MSTRRQTRRTKRVGRLSGSNDLPGAMNLDDSDIILSTDQSTDELSTKSPVGTPVPKRAANEMGDVESSASKRRPSHANTPAGITSMAASEAIAPSPRNIPPTVDFSNKCVVDKDTLARWEAVIEKLTQAAPLIGNITTNAPAQSTSQTKKTSG